MKVYSNLSSILILISIVSFAAFAGAYPTAESDDGSVKHDQDSGEDRDRPINGTRLNGTDDRTTDEQDGESPSGTVDPPVEDILLPLEPVDMPGAGEPVAGPEIIFFFAMVWLAFAFLGKKKKRT